jgi:hypothetical protein
MRNKLLNLKILKNNAAEAYKHAESAAEVVEAADDYVRAAEAYIDIYGVAYADDCDGLER